MTKSISCGHNYTGILIKYLIVCPSCLMTSSDWMIAKKFELCLKRGTFRGNEFRRGYKTLCLQFFMLESYILV